MKRRIRGTLIVVVCVAGAAFAPLGCALTSKAELVGIRYFSPERVEPQRDEQAPKAVNAPPPRLRLGRVSSGPNLRERIAYRDSAYELGYYDDLRWTERPETFVRRELARSLFETQRLTRVVGPVAPILDVELIAFDELRLKAGRAVRIQLRFTLYHDDAVLLEETLNIDRAVVAENPRIEDVVATMSAVLDTVASEVAVKVERVLVIRRSQAAIQPPP